MLKGIKDMGNWVRDLVKTKGGVFVLGLMFGLAPTLVIIHTLYKNEEVKDTSIKQLKSEKIKWQEKAFNAEASCLDKMREMASFFKDLEKLYKKEEVTSKKNLQTEKKHIKKYENITKKLNKMDKRLK